MLKNSRNKAEKTEKKYIELIKEKKRLYYEKHKEEILLKRKKYYEKTKNKRNSDNS